MYSTDEEKNYTP